MAATYDRIASTILSSASSSIVFNSISGAYTDLILACSPISNGSTYAFNIVLNGDTGTNYSYSRIYGSGTTTAADRGSNTANSLGSWSMVSSTGITTPAIVQINNYSNTTTFKTFVTRVGTATAADSYLGAVVSLWRNTNAVTSVEFKVTTNDVAIGSTFTLYGIKAGS